MATLQNSYKKAQIRILIGFIVLCLAVAVILILCRGKVWGHRRIVFEKPQLLVIRYHWNQDARKQVELADIIPLDDITTLKSMNEAGENRSFPTVHGISVEDEEVPIIRVLPLKLSDVDSASEAPKYPEKYRINVFCDGEIFVCDNIEYNGEEYMPVAHGKDWYIAFTRRIR